MYRRSQEIVSPMSLRCNFSGIEEMPGKDLSPGQSAVAEFIIM